MRFKPYFLIPLLLACAAANAEINFGRWSVALGDDKTYVYASTVNDSGAVLGEYCYFNSKKCFWMLGTDSRCDKGNSYPILANSTAGAVQIKISCTGEVTPGVFAYTIDNWADLESALKTGPGIAFAVPMQQDQFRVYRFVLDGVVAATQKAESTVTNSGSPEGKAKSKVSTSTETVVL